MRQSSAAKRISYPYPTEIVSVEDVSNVLGGPEVFGAKPPTTLSEMQQAIALGFPRETLVRTFRLVADTVEANRLAYSVVPKASYHRRARLDSPQSERIERIARVIALAEYVWGNQIQARQFLRTPHSELDGKAPLEMAYSELGARRVEQVLMSIFFGLPV